MTPCVSDLIGLLGLRVDTWFRVGSGNESCEETRKQHLCEVLLVPPSSPTWSIVWKPLLQNLQDVDGLEFLATTVTMTMTINRKRMFLLMIGGV